MTGPQRSLPGGLRSRRCALGVLGFSLSAAALAPVQHHGPARITDPWQAALAARQSFEAEPTAEHTRDEFTQVMDNFRAIYHGNPADFRAARAANEVAELLAEQGRELQDPKSLRAAAGQYEFVAKAYPTSLLAGPALAKALRLLGPNAANDPVESANVRRLLKAQYPHSLAAATAPGAQAETKPSGIPEGKRSSAHVVGDGSAAHPVTVIADGQHYVKPSGRQAQAAPLQAHATPQPAAAPQPVEASALEPRDEAPASLPRLESPAPAVVTGIRHWSTSTYTRVAIDLGGEVEFKAARVENPDRIFFDLHGAKLAAGLAGKSFAITDDGFLKNIQAGQSGADVTRIVLDVQPVAEYSAFILPNPYRLIIDIHGRPGQGNAVNRAAAATGPEVASVSTEAASEQPPAPVTRMAAAPNPGSNTAIETSSLPPMPVTDGSASFGLPARRDSAVSSMTAVARPRVVVSAKPTEARPVPNSVTSTLPADSRSIASVSEGPGVIAATSQPTSQPVVDRHVKAANRSTKLNAARTVSSASIPATPAAPPPLTADGQSTLMRALGLKIGRIVIDAGHGGHDSGTLGPDGIEEKDVVLDVALRLGKLLHDRLGAEVVYTRADDTFIPLETRTAIANKAQADLFISVHANSSGDPDARGVEVYYLNFTSDPEAMEVASRENAVSSQRVTQLSDLVKKIALKDKIDESRELAADVDQSLYGGLKKGNGGLKDRGVKKAPFVVLIGANMPSILAEISFVTNPTDASKLSQPEYRERVAESLYAGVAHYAGEINGDKPRQRTTERAER